MHAHSLQYKVIRQITNVIPFVAHTHTVCNTKHHRDEGQEQSAEQRAGHLAQRGMCVHDVYVFACVRACV